MKEKTFEELIRERIDKGDAFTPTGIIEMMKQVREATIAECRENLWNEYGLYRDFYEIKKEFDNLPTDRIKLTDK